MYHKPIAEFHIVIGTQGREAATDGRAGCGNAGGAAVDDDHRRGAPNPNLL